AGLLRAEAALAEQGEGFQVNACVGAARVPEEADEVSEVMSLADRRLYQQKLSRGPERPPALTRLVEAPDGGGFASRVAPLVGARLGLAGEELEILTRAAQLHDI